MTDERRGEVVLGGGGDVFSGGLEDAMRTRYGPLLRSFAIPACRVYRSTSQGLTTGVATPLTFDGEVFDSASCHEGVVNPARLFAPTAGIYSVGCHAAIAAGTGRQLWGQVNAADTTSNRFVAVAAEGGGTEWQASVNAVVRLNAGDWVAFSVYHTTGSTINATYYSVALRPEAWMTWIGGVG